MNNREKIPTPRKDGAYMLVEGSVEEVRAYLKSTGISWFRVYDFDETRCEIEVRYWLVSEKALFEEIKRYFKQ